MKTLNAEMKMKLKNVIFLLLLFKMCFIFGQETLHQKRIVIDVGHGGKDPGAIGVNGILEKDVVLQIGLEMIELNTTVFNNTFEIYLTRYSDTLISLGDRTELANALNADIFISLHCNHSEDPKAKGVEVYVFNKKSEHLRRSISLAYQLQKLMREQLGFISRGVKFANFQVLREMENHCPAILLEAGFITNSDEGSHFLKPSNIKALALAILMKINNHLKI